MIRVVCKKGRCLVDGLSKYNLPETVGITNGSYGVAIRVNNIDDSKEVVKAVNILIPLFIKGLKKREGIK